ncbi:H-NS histone family protein [Roseateles aquatilis]|nr:H-NS histone family protein [Roseateles aquatilis]
MSKSLQQVLQQIDKLQKQAEQLRAKEVSQVVASIRQAIDHYGLTRQELFGPALANTRRRRTAKDRAGPVTPTVERAARRRAN